MAEDEIDSIADSMDLNVGKLLDIADTEKPGMLQSVGWQSRPHGQLSD